MISPLRSLFINFVSLLCLAAAAGPTAPAAERVPIVLIPPDLAAFLPDIRVADKTSVRIETVPVTGRPFATALRLATLQPSAQPWQLGVAAPVRSAIKRGDVLWVTFQSRRITSRQESGEAVAEVTLMQKTKSGGEERPLERGFTCGLDWVETSIPFVAVEDTAPGDSAFAIRFGAAVQSLEVGGITLLNYGHGADLAALPHTVTRYEGHAPDAPWRAAAAARIEKIRKGDFPLRVVDSAGQPVADAEVAVRMKRHAFAWGTTVDSGHIIDDQSPNGIRYRDILEKYFNKVVFDNELKWGSWLGQTPADRARILKAIDWFDARGIPVRGAVLLWPSWKNSPKFIRQFEHDPAGLRAAIKQHIAGQTSVYGERLAEWDVINETFMHKDYMNLLGREAMVDWFRETRQGAPKVKLFYNDYVMFHGSTPDAPSQYLYDLIQFLKEKGAPVDGIGEQAHFGGNPPGPAQIVATLDRFGVFGLPIEITEFDIETPDTQLQADFTRDFTTAVFSHPAVTGMVQWGFWAGAHWKPSAALWDWNWSIRPAGQAWVDLVSKTWWTNADGRTAADGTYTTRGFYGDYEVTVTHSGKSCTVRLKLQPGALPQAIVLP